MVCFNLGWYLQPALCCPPGDDSRKKMGSYLIQSQFQTGVHTTSFFLTASAQVRRRRRTGGGLDWRDGWQEEGWREEEE